VSNIFNRVASAAWRPILIIPYFYPTCGSYQITGPICIKERAQC